MPQYIWNNVWDFLTDTSERVGSWAKSTFTVPKVVQPGETVDDGTPKISAPKKFDSGKIEAPKKVNLYEDAKISQATGKELKLDPTGVRKSDNMLADLGKDVASGFSEAGKFLLQTPAKFTVGVMQEKGTLKESKGEPYVPSNAAEKWLFGEEPIKPIGQQLQETTEQQKSGGFGLASLPIAVGAVVGAPLLDFFGAGKSKNVITNLAKEESVNVIAKWLRSKGVAEELILPYAERFAKEKSPTVIEEGLNSLAKVSQSTNKALNYTTSILQEGQKLAKQSGKMPTNKLIGDMMTNWYDQYHSVNVFMQNVEKTIGRKLTMKENAYVGARFYSGVSGKIENKLDDLGIILRENPEHVDNGNLSAYLFNQRNLERANKGFYNPGNIDAKIAQKALVELEKAVGSEAFKQIQKQAAEFYTYGNDLLDYAFEGGLIDQATLKASKEGNAFHVPFDIIENMIGGDTFIPTGGRAFSVASQEIIKELKGTTQLVDDPLNAMVRRTIKLVDAVERNKVATTLVDVTKLDKNLKAVVIPLSKQKDIPKGFVGITVVQETGEEAAFAVRKEVADSFTSKTVTKAELDALKTETVALGKVNEVPKGFGTISILRDGKKEMYAIPLDVADAMKRMSQVQVGGLVKTAAIFANVLRATVTTYNPLFVIKNAWRDFNTATLVSEYGFSLADWSRGFAESFKNTASKYGMKVNNNLYKEYLQEAGQIGGFYSTYLNKVPQTVKDLTKPEWQKLAGLVNPFKFIKEVGKATEEATRLGVYMRALSSGVDKGKAAFASRNATVDFAKMGSSMRVLNQITPFINARVQGQLNILGSLKNAKGNPKRMAELGLKIGALAIVPYTSMYYWNTMKYPDVWDDLSPHVKSNYFVFIYGYAYDEDSGEYTQVVKIPKGDMNLFIDPVQDFLEYTRGNKPDLFRTIATDTLFNLLPVSTNDDLPIFQRAAQGATGLLPPPAQATLEAYQNKNLYTGTPIVPQRIVDENRSPELQYKENTTLIAKEIGKWLKISPLIIENSIRRTFGQVGAESMAVAGTVKEPGATFPFKAGFKRTFTTARGGDKEQKEIEEIKKYDTMGADRRFVAKEAAQRLWDYWKTEGANNPQEVLNMLNDLKDDPEIAKQFESIITKEGAEYPMTFLKTIAPKERALYIFDRTEALKGEEKLEFLKRIRDSGVYTDAVDAELNLLLPR